jgi:small subunit ribosomal protein S17
MAKTVKKTEKQTVAEPKAAQRLRKHLTGVVTSNKMKKTIVVRVDRQVKDSMYTKYVVRSTKYKVHDEKNDAKIGDVVAIVESRPISKDKCWALQKIVRRSEAQAVLGAEAEQV